MKRLKDSEVIEKFDLLLANVARPEIAPRVLVFGYGPEALQADQTVVVNVRTARAGQQKEQTEAYAATAAETELKSAGREAFLQLHRIIRMADRRDRSLDLKHILQVGPLPHAEVPFLDYTSSLLDRIEALPEALAALALFGVNQERISELRDLIQSIRQANITQQQEQNEAQQATAVYREYLEQLRLAYDMLTGIGREALAGDEELLALMGLG